MPRPDRPQQSRTEADPSRAKNNNDIPAAKESSAPLPEVDHGGPALHLSLTQIAASALAAVTAAFAGSRLGVAGTIVGAAVASAVSIVAGALYAHSIAATGHRMRRAIQVRRGDDVPALRPSTRGRALLLGMSGAAVRLRWWQRDRPVPRAAEHTGPEHTGLEHTGPERTGGPVGRSVGPSRWGLRTALIAAGGAAAAFVLALALITGIEAVKGSPLAGGASGGLTVFGGQSVEHHQPTGGGTGTVPQAERGKDSATTGVVTTSGAATSSGSPSSTSSGSSTSPTDGESGSPSSGPGSATGGSTAPSTEGAAGSGVTSSPSTAPSTGQSAPSTDQPAPSTDQSAPSTDQPAPSTGESAPSSGQPPANATAAPTTSTTPPANP